MLIRCRVVAVCIFLFCAVMGARAQVLTEPVGTTSAVQTATLTITTGGTLGAINVLTKGAANLDFNFVSGGTCAVGTTYSANSTCTVEYTFKPTAPGARYGGITLTSGNTLLASTYVSGTGTGPQVTYPPGVQSQVASGFSRPFGLAFDGSGNLFAADYGSGEVKELLAATGYTTVYAIPASGTNPVGVAVDGVGNLFVTEYNTVSDVKEIFATGGYTTAITIGSGFNFPEGVAVDGSGDVFVADNGDADNGDNDVKEILAAGDYSTVVTLPGSYSGPGGVAVDGSGNVFVADTFHGQVKEILAAGGYTNVIALPLFINNVSAVAVDCNGNVFAGSPDDGTVRELFAASGYSTQATYSNLPLAEGIALDATGNVFVSEYFGDTIQKLDFADPPTLSFVATPVGQTSTDSPKTVTLMNSGNAPLTFSTPAAGTNPSISAGFTLGNSSTCPQLSAMSTPVALGVGATCTDVVSFHPVVVGTITGQLTTTDNALNAAGATQVIPLGGTGTPATTISTLTVSPNPVPVGAAVTLTANVAPNPASANVPTGTVTFYNGAVNIGVATLNGSAAATLTTSALPAGTDNLSCVYSGDSNFAGSNCAAVPLDVTVPQTIVFPAPPSPAYAGTSVLLTATASSGLPVTYSVISGPADVSGAVLHYNGAGTVVVQAQQAGNVTYSPAASVQDSVSTTLLSVPVGTQSAAATTTVTIGTAGVLSAIQVLTQGAANLDFNLAAGGTCLAGTAYIAGQTCNVTFTFTPAHPGLRFGGILLVSSGQVTLGATNMYGLGTGPQVIYSPATQSLLGGTYSYPTGVAVDAAGDVFLSDENSNAVFEIPVGTGVSRQLGTFALPDDVAVDGAGNVFVIYNRTSLAEILAVNGTIPANPAINVISTGFAALNGMKVDGNGNVYLAESFTGGSGSMIQEVLSVNGYIPTNPTVLTLVSGVGGPTGVAIDALGDVFFSDEIQNTAWEALAVNGVIPANPTVVPLANGLKLPTNIALDAAGDVFVSEQDGIVEIVAVNGSVPSNPTVLSLGTNLVFPQGLAVDASGNVFIADDGIPQAVKLDFADAPSLTFATTQVGSTSSDSPQTVSLINDGNANLSWAAPVVGTDPTITAGYKFTSTCGVIEAGTALAYAVPEGGSCAESISFTPVAAGPDPGKFTLTDNDLNVVGAQQNILLNATGTTTATALTLTSSSNPAYALQPVAFTVQLTSNGKGDAGQTVTLSYLYGTLVGTAVLTTDSTGTASYTFPTLPPLDDPGSYRVSAVFTGTTSYQASHASITQVVIAIPTSSTLTIAPNPPFTNTSETLTATVVAQLSGPPTGTVTFSNGTTALGTVALSNGVAQLAIGTLAAGNYTFNCTYNGATAYAMSTCTPLNLTVQPPSDFSLTANPPSITIETQHHKTMQLTLTSIGPFAGPVTLGCQAPLPPYLTCELPASETLTAGQTLNFNFTMDTDAVLNFLAENSPGAEPAQTHALNRIVFALLLPLTLAGFARRRKMLRRVMLLLVLAVGATALTACGDKWPAHTPPGTYTITVVGTGTTSKGLTSHTLPITLTVTP